MFKIRIHLPNPIVLDIYGYMDVVSLYLSLDHKVSAKIVAEEVVASDITYDDLDMNIAGVADPTVTKLSLWVRTWRGEEERDREDRRVFDVW